MSKKPESHPCAGCGEKLISVDAAQCLACEDRDVERRAAWVAFCAAELSTDQSCVVRDIGAVGDQLLAAYDARFPKRRK